MWSVTVTPTNAIKSDKDYTSWACCSLKEMISASVWTGECSSSERWIFKLCLNSYNKTVNSYLLNFVLKMALMLWFSTKVAPSCLQIRKQRFKNVSHHNFSKNRCTATLYFVFPWNEAAYNVTWKDYCSFWYDLKVPRCFSKDTASVDPGLLEKSGSRTMPTLLPCNPSGLRNCL